MLKTVQYRAHWLDPEKCPSFLETESFSKTQLKFILKANTQSLTDFDKVKITPAPCLKI